MSFGQSGSCDACLMFHLFDTVYRLQCRCMGGRNRACAFGCQTLRSVAWQRTRLRDDCCHICALLGCCDQCMAPCKGSPPQPDPCDVNLRSKRALQAQSRLLSEPHQRSLEIGVGMGQPAAQNGCRDQDSPSGPAQSRSSSRLTFPQPNPWVIHL